MRGSERKEGKCSAEWRRAGGFIASAHAANTAGFCGRAAFIGVETLGSGEETRWRLQNGNFFNFFSLITIQHVDLQKYRCQVFSFTFKMTDKHMRNLGKISLDS